jgi:predicted adenylyl cyclase CyaB
MSKNVEIKAFARDFERQQALAAELADSGPQWIRQRDTFFHVPRGRLKLRQFAEGDGELIQYDRVDDRNATTSNYTVVATDKPDQLRSALGDALGIRGEVVKKRCLYLAGQTRIHFDQVDTLGQFIELEVVMQDGQDVEQGEQVAAGLIDKLGIRQSDLIDCAYIDLIERREN